MYFSMLHLGLGTNIISVFPPVSRPAPTFLQCRLFVDLHLVHFAFGYFNLAGIATFILIELLLLSMAVSVHPALMVTRREGDNFRSTRIQMYLTLAV